jgi:hypothetical protein
MIDKILKFVVLRYIIALVLTVYSRQELCWMFDSLFPRSNTKYVLNISRCSPNQIIFSPALLLK